MGECGRRVHGHPQELDPWRGLCLWLFRSMLPRKTWPVGFMAQRIMGKIWWRHPTVQLSASFGDLICGLWRLMLYREAPYCASSPHALGKTRIASGAGQRDDSEFGPAKRSHVDKNPDRLGPPATTTSDRQRQPTNPSKSLMILVTQHFSPSLTLPAQTTDFTCSVMRTRTYKEPGRNKIYPLWHESVLNPVLAVKKQMY